MSIYSGWDNVIKAERERLGMDEPNTPSVKVEAKQEKPEQAKPEAAPESNDNNVVPMEKKPRAKKAPKK